LSFDNAYFWELAVLNGSFPLGVCGRIHSMEGEYPHSGSISVELTRTRKTLLFPQRKMIRRPAGKRRATGSTSEFRRMHAGVACGTEGNQVLLGILAGLAAKFLVMNLKI
jgi:hypothetical protein